MARNHRKSRKRNSRSRKTRRYRGGYTCISRDCPAGGRHDLGNRISQPGNYEHSYRTCTKCGCRVMYPGPAA